jgi:hypothetical protein
MSGITYMMYDAYTGSIREMDMVVAQPLLNEYKAKHIARFTYMGIKGGVA